MVQLQAADILDTIDIRLAVLKNDNLMEYMNDEQLQYNIQYVLRIVLRGKVIDESIETELVQSMIKLFMTTKARNIALIVFTQLINTNLTINECFKEAMKKSISHQLNTPDKIAIFLQCTAMNHLK